MVTHTWNLCSEFNPSKCTHTVVNTHPEQWETILMRCPMSCWGFGALLKGLTSVVVLKVEVCAGYSLQNQNYLIIETLKVLGGFKNEWISIIVGWLCPQICYML